ncbi:MAG TPA: sterol desaturase family protein [Anaerolineaceae bacterium]|nr:sterol desaturase family protein [Anaerolineaceae bacterium]
MDHLPISHNEESIRLFKSDFLEFFTHISPIVIIVIWLPIALYLLVTAFKIDPYNGFPFYIFASFIIGLFVWTLTEYLLHRFIFHFRPHTPFQERVTFLFHGIHHATPQDKTRLVMPPIVSIPLALLFFGLFNLILNKWLGIWLWIYPMFSGFLIGYLIYDLTHYATHHFPMRYGYLKYIKRHHMQHHYKTPNQRFGVSSPLWDKVFRTLPD